MKRHNINTIIPPHEVANPTGADDTMQPRVLTRNAEASTIGDHIAQAHDRRIRERRMGELRSRCISFATVVGAVAWLLFGQV